ncbi:MAG: Rrf2 family transcriptional regulator [Pirellulaceae bacterium]|nr:Rrf2 family transcriptional regulator [Planctomycetales bacterium]
MHVSAKSEYACIALLELAASFGSGEPVQIRKIAETHGIPPRFLVQILLQLKGAGLVSSTRGAAGGYQLVRDPRDITLSQVMQIIDGQPTTLASNASNVTATSNVLLKIWRAAADAEQTILDSTTFADLAEQVKNEAEDMYYI